jgi:hypothetical protein
MGFTKTYRRKRKTRHKVLSGFSLYQHHKALAANKNTYIPPSFYDAMKSAPPLQGPFHSQFPAKARFPDDRLRKKIEIQTDHGKEVSRIGIVPIPWWFMNRPIDDALKRVKQIMIENPEFTEDQALAQWDLEFYRMKRVRELEIQLLAQQAKKDGNHITIFDSFNLIRMMKDMQVESHTIKEYRIQRARREQSSMSFTKEMPTPETILDTKEFNKDETVHVQLNSSQRRKLLAALEVAANVKKIIFYRSRHRVGQVPVPSSYEPTDQDYVDVFAKAFDVDKIPATSPEWGKEKSLTTGEINGVKAYDFLKDLYSEFKEKWNRFSRITEVTYDIGKFTSSLDLGFGDKNPFSQTNVIDLYSKHGLYPVDLGRYIWSYKGKRGYDYLANNQKALEGLVERLKIAKMTKQFELNGDQPIYKPQTFIQDLNAKTSFVGKEENVEGVVKPVTGPTNSGINLQDVVKLLKTTVKKQQDEKKPQ